MKKFDPAAYLTGLNINEMHFGLEAVTALLERFGAPQNTLRTILVGGTNGKGSTAVLISSMLKEEGFKVGLYTSPHLVDVRERIVIGTKKIPLKEFSSILARIRDEAPLPVTYFEILTAAALIYFQSRQVDIAVMEVGLGGRLDATNVCRPEVSVITNISLEHTNYLGKTIAAITAEKAGIIRPGGICITGASQNKALEVISSVCQHNKARLYRLGHDFKIVRRDEREADYTGIKRRIKALNLSLRGAHQWSNAALALATLEVLHENGFVVSDRSIRRGLEKTRWEARLEVLCRHPLFIIDGAHNPAGIAALLRALEYDFPGRRLILIFAALADKDYRRMMQKIVPRTATVILPQLKSDRAVNTGELAGIVKGLGVKAHEVPDVCQAVSVAMSQAGKGDMILAAGSLYLAGEIKQSFPQTSSCDKA